MAVSSLWYNGKIAKAENRHNRGEQFKYEYDIKDPAFRLLQEAAVTSTEAAFDRELPLHIGQVIILYHGNGEDE